jgi:hypothetical protein
MKWNILVGSLMLGASLCAPSFGGGLLDRMLGLRGAGCDSACCDTGCAAAPSCGCELSACGSAAPSCGCEMSACGNGIGGCGLFGRLRGPSCGCEIAACDPCASAAPSCGCEINACGPGRSGCGLFGGLRGPSCGCEIAACDPCASAAPSCGCEMACGSCGPTRRRPFLELIGRIEARKRAVLGGLFNHSAGCDTGCCAAPSCGCEMAAPSCGCEIAAPSCGCGNAAPSCGCEVVSSCGGCDSGCAPRAGLLSRLFQRRHSLCGGCDAGCDSGCTSCGSAVSAPAVHGDAAPMPPAPVVDPSAYMQTNRRVVQATSFVR